MKVFPPRNVKPPQLACLAACFLIVAWIGCSDIPETWIDDADGTSRPVSESWNVAFRVTESDLGADDSRPRLHLESPYMATYETDSTYTLLRGDDSGVQVRAHIFDKETGESSAVITADEIVYNDRERRFIASGDVYVDADGGRRLNSERLIWHERSRHVFAPGFVRIVTPRERLEGYNLDADENLDNYRLARVTGQAQIEDE